MLVTEKAPNFNSQAINRKNKIINFDLYKDTKDKKVLLFFWPLDFTFVCPSEIISLNNRYENFKKRNVKILGISIDSIYTHLAWKNTPINKGGIGNKINFLIISDIKRKIQKLYNTKHKETGTSLRATFLIDEKKIIRHISINDLQIGRNINEILRIIDAIDINSKTKNVCPAQWDKNKETIKPNYKNICEFLKKNHKKL